MKRYALAATLSLLFGGAAQAAAIDLGASPPAHDPPMAEPSAATRIETAALPSMSELPEPEVFTMMVVGLILIGYRARRDSSEKFK